MEAVNWISLEQESMPLETPIIVSHPHGVEAIQFWNGYWRLWYKGEPIRKELLRSITHWAQPQKAAE